MEILNGDSIIKAGDLDPENVTEIRPSRVQVYFPNESEFSPTEHAANCGRLKGNNRFNYALDLPDPDRYKEYVFIDSAVSAGTRVIKTIIGNKPWEN